MQIRVLKDALTLIGHVKKDEFINVSDVMALSLIRSGIAEIYEPRRKTKESNTKQSKTARKTSTERKNA